MTESTRETIYTYAPELPVTEVQPITVGLLTAPGGREEIKRAARSFANYLAAYAPQLYQVTMVETWVELEIEGAERLRRLADMHEEALLRQKSEIRGEIRSILRRLDGGRDS